MTATPKKITWKDLAIDGLKAFLLGTGADLEMDKRYKEQKRQEKLKKQKLKKLRNSIKD